MRNGHAHVPSSPPPLGTSPLTSNLAVQREVGEVSVSPVQTPRRSSSRETGASSVSGNMIQPNESIVSMGVNTGPAAQVNTVSEPSKRTLAATLYAYRLHMQRMELFWNSIQRIARDANANNCVVCLELESEIRMCSPNDGTIRTAFAGDENLDADDMEQTLSTLRRVHERRLRCLHSLLDAIDTYCHRPLMRLAPGEVSKKMKQFVLAFQDIE